MFVNTVCEVATPKGEKEIKGEDYKELEKYNFIFVWEMEVRRNPLGEIPLEEIFMG